MKGELKLYVWYDVRCDYTEGIAFALAHTVYEARKEIKKVSKDWEWKLHKDELYRNKPKIYRKPFGFWMSGGG